MKSKKSQSVISDQAKKKALNFEKKSFETWANNARSWTTRKMVDTLINTMGFK